MDVLFLHGNYPGQFWHLAEGMGRKPSNRVVFLTNRSDPETHRLAGVDVRRYEPHREVTQAGHSYLRSSERAVLAGQAVVRSLSVLLQEGFRPRLVIAHGGNGLLLFLRQLLPKSCLVGYFEWWFNDHQAPWLFGEDSLDSRMRMVCRNGITLQELELCDLAVTPTAWQRSQFPLAQQQRLQVVFDGVDTSLFRPQPWLGDLELKGEASEQALRLPPEARILSYATRGMEPLRGFPEFMQMLPALMLRFADLEVVVAGRDRVAAMGAVGKSDCWLNWGTSLIYRACISPVCSTTAITFACSSGVIFIHLSRVRTSRAGAFSRLLRAAAS